MARELSIPDQHLLKISRASMRMHCIGVRIMGGPNHIAAAENTKRLAKKAAPIAADCTCGGR